MILFGYYNIIMTSFCSCKGAWLILSARWRSFAQKAISGASHIIFESLVSIVNGGTTGQQQQVLVLHHLGVQVGHWWASGYFICTPSYLWLLFHKVRKQGRSSVDMHRTEVPVFKKVDQRTWNNSSKQFRCQNCHIAKYPRYEECCASKSWPPTHSAGTAESANPDETATEQSLQFRVLLVLNSVLCTLTFVIK